jgi:hypothetical protein
VGQAPCLRRPPRPSRAGSRILPSLTSDSYQRDSENMLISALATLMLLGADPVIYLGCPVTIVDPGTEDPDGFYPKGEAQVCVQGQQPKDCYTAPKGVGRNPSLSVVELRKGESALFFEAASGGVSGFSLHFALLEFCNRAQFPGCKEDELKDLLSVEVSNQSQHAWWVVTDISDSKVFLTADYVWGPAEAHYSDHRFIISVYVRRPNDLDGLSYYLVDRFMTARFYGFAKDGELDDVLGAEKQEIVARLQKAKTFWPELQRDGR